MSVVAVPSNRSIIDQVRRLAALEYALVESCHSDSSSVSELEQAILASRAGTAQVHLFDLGTALRELGEESLSYSRCIRQALLQSGTHTEVLRRLEREYERLLDRQELPAGLRVLLRANLAEHRGLSVHDEYRAQWAA